MRKPPINELIGLFIILAACAVILYSFYNNEPAPTIANSEYNYSDMVFATFPYENLNQTTVKINASYIVNMTEQNGILTIIIRND